MNSDQAAVLRRDECRRAVLAHLYARPSVAQSADTIARMLRTQHDFALDEVTGACSYLLSAGLVDTPQNSMSGLKHFQITAKGTREHEVMMVV